MKDKVLSIEQMQELIDMGIDTSKASMFWHPAFYRINGILDYDRYEDIPRIKLENNYNLEYDIPTFTLQDILKMLPKRISITSEHTDKSEYWGFNALRIGYPSLSEDLYIEYTQDPYMNSAWACFNAEHSILDATFNMLKWCKESNHI